MITGGTPEPPSLITPDGPGHRPSIHLPMSSKKSPLKTIHRRKASLNPGMTYQVTRGEITISIQGSKIADLVYDDFMARHGKQESLAFTQPENEKP